MPLIQCIGVVGSSGAVGAEMIKCLGQREFPSAQLRLFARRAAGTVVRTYLGDVSRNRKLRIEFLLQLLARPSAAWS